MVRKLITAALMAFSLNMVAQEVLLPLRTSATSVAQPALKTSASSVVLPFFDDFTGYTGFPDADLWEPSGATVNIGFAHRPTTLGMMTLDALDSDGNLYPQATASLFTADTACSLPIKLDTYTEADSLVMSFYYLPGGGSGNMWERIGDVPEARDSLILEFFCSADSLWNMVWCTGGVSEDSLIARTGLAWQYVCVKITESCYFDSTFRFRFRNLASIDGTDLLGMSGDSDQWNIDYVLLDKNRTTVGTPIFRDIAFVAPAPSMLKNYRAMPARQYRTSEMASNIAMTIVNLYDQQLASHYFYAVVDAHADTIYKYDGGYDNAPAFLPGANYQTASAHANPPVGFSFDEGTDWRDYEIVHVVREGTGGDIHKQNDTARYIQHFANYYAYDDGTPENGYGITSTSSKIYLAYRFDLNEADTLVAIDIFFNSALNDENLLTRFYLTVWQMDENGQPGSVIYRDRDRRTPACGGFIRYILESAVVISGQVFVGLEQVGNDYINIGYDRSLNTADRLMYHTSTMWQNSILSGSLMLRPCFGAASVGIGLPIASDSAMVLYPNPCNGRFRIDGTKEGGRVMIFDAKGSSQRFFTTGEVYDVTDLQDGVYFVTVVANDGSRKVSKLVILH